MRLYYFTSTKYGLQAIKKQRLKVARISELNDPFEFLGWNLNDPLVRAKLTAWKRERDKELGLLCFSAKWSHPLLWGHYAEKHKGLALGFDVPEGDLFKVRYRRKRLPDPIEHQLVESLNELLTTKFTAWRYETEYRAFHPLHSCISENGLFFSPFSSDLQLSEVIVGDRSQVTRAQLRRVLGKDHAHVPYFKARPAFGSFLVVRNRNDTLWS